MRRREFITLLGGAAAASSSLWPLAARAQQAERVRRVGALWSLPNDAEGQPLGNALQEELAKLGWVEGRNLHIDNRFAGGDIARMRAYAVELASLGPDVIFTNGVPATRAMQQQTRTIPIVFAGAGGIADDSDIVRNITHPEGNTTGATNLYFSVAGKWPQLLKEAAPRLARIAVILNPFNTVIPGGGGYAAAINAAASSLGTPVTWISYRVAADLEPAIAAFAANPDGGLITAPANGAVLDVIIRLAAEYKLPAIYPMRNWARQGGLMSYGSSSEEILRQSASYVDRILRGAKPGDLPVQFPTKFELAINLKTARAIGLDIPPVLLGIADEVIE
jgi:putative ABC transport system substrate-binding protein